jgi:hypothetical protein
MNGSTMNKKSRQTLVTRSRCWFRDFLNRKTELRESDRITLQDLDRAARDAHLYNKTGDVSYEDVALYRLLDILHLGRNEILQREPAAYRSLLHHCTHCARTKECARGFTAKEEEIWPRHCPNALTLEHLLDAKR